MFAGRNEARLCFVEGASVRFDAFPDYLSHEVIPVIWDCWPRDFEAMRKWFKRHKVQTAIFTSSQTAQKMQECNPQMNVLTITEGIETELYFGGLSLEKREYDFIEFGRCCKTIDSNKFNDKIKVLSSRRHWKGNLQTREQLIKSQESSRITIALTRQDTQPQIAEGIDTLTQRYWECMLSRIVMVGHAPKELTDLIGYDPVITIDQANPIAQIEDMLMHIGNYQDLVDRNRETALRLGNWSLRAKQIMDWLQGCGYKI